MIAPPARSRRALALLAAASALLLAACGEDDGGSAASGEGPSALASPDAALYVETVVRPEGETAETIERLATAAGVEDPGGLIVEKLNEGAAEDGVEFSYEEDIEPWLGERAGIVFNDAEAFVAAASDESDAPPANFAVTFETTDTDAAQDSLDRLIELGAEEDPDAELSEASYEDIEYTLLETEDAVLAAGLVDGFLVVGDEPAFQAAIDASSSGEALTDSAEFADSVEQLAEDPSFALYVDTPALLAAAERMDLVGPEDQAALDLYGAYLEQPIVAAAAVDSEAVELGFSTGSLGLTLAEEGLLEGLPADAWFAFAQPETGEYLGSFVEQLRADPEFRAQFEAGNAEIERRLGKPLDEVLGSLGDLTAYARGESPLEIDGALSLATSDPQTARRLLDLAAQQARRDGEQVEPLDIEGVDGFQFQPDGAPMPVLIFLAGDEIVASYGEQAGLDAIDPTGSETLGESEAFSAAAEALGDLEPGAYLDVEPVADLLGTVPIPSDEVDSDRLLAVVDELDYLIVGVGTDAGRDLTKYRFGLDG